MIPKITPKMKSTFIPPQKNLPHKEVIISSKNGKDRIENILIGGVPHYSVIDFIRDIFNM